MTKAGIALDRWKGPIFRRHLKGAGFEWTEGPGLTPDTMLFSVLTDDVTRLHRVIEAAQLDCAGQ